MNESMNKLFNSQVCTTKEQSQRLLDLGLKPETADMKHYFDDRSDYSFFHRWEFCPYKWNEESLVDSENIPAWSLHRLIEMMPTVITQDDYSLILGVNATCVYYATDEYTDYEDSYAETFNDPECNLYDCVVKCIEWLIKEGHFNKDYLKQ